MRQLLWAPYVAYLRLRGPQAASRAVFRCPDRLRRQILTAFGARIGPRTRIKGPLVIMGQFEDFSGLSIGENTYVGPDCLLDLTAGVHIGSRCAISARCSFVTHLDVGRGELARLYPPSSGAIEVDDDTWLGLGTTVLHGARIGRRAMVAAGAVVRGAVPAGRLYGGVPARQLKELAPHLD